MEKDELQFCDIPGIVTYPSYGLGVAVKPIPYAKHISGCEHKVAVNIKDKLELWYGGQKKLDAKLLKRLVGSYIKYLFP